MTHLTGLNDVAQYVSGQAFGRHKPAPSVSPNKTVKGLAGGLFVTALVAASVDRFITPLTPGFCAFLGAAVALGGFLGDLTISGIKRDLAARTPERCCPAMAAFWTASTA